MSSSMIRRPPVVRPSRWRHRLALGALAATLVSPLPAGAGGTPDPGSAGSPTATLPNQLIHQAGEDRLRANGDWVSDEESPALNTYYQYFIEVPPGQSSLQVQIYDADIGNGGTNDAHDGLIGGTWNTSVTYQLRTPTDGVSSTVNLGAASCGSLGSCNNAWVTAFTVANPQSGHWALRVQTTSGGDDHNNYGIRAHDGNAGTGGTEYNVYAQSYVGMGESAASHNINREYHFFPYVYRGCTVDINDFDADNGGGNNAGDYDLATRAGVGLLSNFGALSANDAWNNNPVTGWTSDFAANDYGLWRLFFDGAPAGGNGANNVYTIYIGADSSPNPAPSTQPVASAVRIYFPRDGSSYANGSGTINLPAKAHVGHTWAKVAGQPPIAVGTTTRIQVTVTVTNPAAFPILFSAASGSGNRVTATVPTNSGQTAYVAGSAAVSQGAVAVTGAGPWTVNWGPGSLAAGATATLTYRIDITPTSPGAKLLTGTPAASGTTATWVDETCSTTNCGTGTRLNNATFTFGPLCELRATVQDLTAALVADFRAVVEDGGVVVEWETAAEAGTLAFELNRRERGRWRRVAERPLAAVHTAPQGGVYRLADPAASPREAQTYLLVELEPDGTRRSHGPFTVQPSWDAEAAAGGALADGYRATPRRQDRRQDDHAAASAGARTPAVPTPPGSGLKQDRAARLGIAEPGVYRVEAAELAPLLDVPAWHVEDLIEQQALRLTSGGLEVAWWDGGGAVEFYARGIDSPYTRENVYFLRFGNGLAPAAPVAPPPPAAPPGLAFREHLDVERDLRVVVLLALDPEGDNWFWEILQAGHPTNSRRTFALDVPGLAPDAGSADLAVRLHGGSNAHHVVAVEVNGVTVGTTSVSSTNPATATFAVPAGVLVPGANQVALTATAGGFVLVDGFALSYDRLYEAAGSRLALRGDGHPAVTVRRLGAGPRVLEVGDPLRPAWVSAAVEPDDGGGGGGGWQATFAPAAPDAEYLAYDAAFVRRPPTVAADFGSGYLARGFEGADYLVIAPAGLTAAAGELAAYRAAGGLRTLVVDLQDVYDEVTAGVADPRAIPTFLRAVRKRWTRPPRYVVLAGAGTYDYRDNLGLGGNLVPPLLALSDLGAPSLYATDALYGDLTGDDGVPEVAVGRIPVTTAAALSAYVDKLIAYESAAAHPGAGRVVLAADQADAAGDFRTDGERMADRLAGGYDDERIWLSDFPTTAAARTALFDALGEGAGALVYLGHGGADRLAGEGLLTNADVAGLGNGDRLPVVAAVTCHIGLFALPGFDALGELLVREPAGGAIAVFAPGWLSTHSSALVLGEALVPVLTEGGLRLGDAVREAMAIASSRGTPRTVLHTYQLFGDPALAVRLAPAAADPGDPPDPGGA